MLCFCVLDLFFFDLFGYIVFVLFGYIVFCLIVFLRTCLISWDCSFHFVFLMYIYVLKNQYVILLDLFLSFEFLFKIVGFIFWKVCF